VVGVLQAYRRGRRQQGLRDLRSRSAVGLVIECSRR
jgi:hypothetical protein